MTPQEFPLLKISDLNFSYGNTKVLESINFEMNYGHISCILGPSGSGKSTLFNLITALLHFDAGSIKIDNLELSSIPEELVRTKYIGIIFQKFELYPHMNVLDNVISSIWHVTQDYEKNKQLATGILKNMGIHEHINKLPDELSGGQKQRVGIARALINSPKLIVADEPTSNLDTDTSEKIMEILGGLKSKEHGIIYSTHNLNNARYADNVFILKDGKLNEIEEERLIKSSHFSDLY